MPPVELLTLQVTEKIIDAAKATGALGMGFGSREMAKRAAGAPVFFGALSAITGGMIAPSPGSLLIRSSTESCSVPWA